MGEVVYVSILFNPALNDRYLLHTWVMPVLDQLSLESLLTISGSRPDLYHREVHDTIRDKLANLKPGDGLSFWLRGELLNIKINKTGPTVSPLDCTPRAISYYDQYINGINTSSSMDSLYADLDECVIFISLIHVV